jgi:oxygen-independent coproporphyrinogen III oxidase
LEKESLVDGSSLSTLTFLHWPTGAFSVMTPLSSDSVPSALSVFTSATTADQQRLLRHYNVSGPRYTSYPTVPAWQEEHNATALQAELLLQRQASRKAPYSLYVHIPFCEHRCLFCGCNVIITQQRQHAETYLNSLEKEFQLWEPHLDTSRLVTQFHLGGGTPTYLSSEQLERLMAMVKSRFTFEPDAEVALELDPRVTTPEQIHTLKRLGFNRVSMGLQDMDPKVQEAIHRIQPYEQTEALLSLCRQEGFQGTNLDLIYGLPYQSLASFQTTLDQVLELQPERIALYNFAYVPWLSPHQKQMPLEAIPSAEVKFEIFKHAIVRFLEAGYLYIGMDHFAKPTDELAQALQAGTLHRNFMGYTTRAGQADLLGFGISAISALEGAFFQNRKKLSTWYQALDANELPAWRGVCLNADDKLRRAVIQELLCQGQVSFAKYPTVEMETYFGKELKALKAASEDGLLTFTCSGLELTPLGRIFSRNVAMQFDAYLQGQQADHDAKGLPLFSKTV